MSLGIIGGSSLLKSPFFSNLPQKVVSTVHGKVRCSVREDGRLVFIQRHHADPAIEYSPPHLINAKAIMRALQELGVNKIIAFGSVGSLHAEKLPIGTLLLPDDYFSIQSPVCSMFEDQRSHVVPEFDPALRAEVLGALNAVPPAGIDALHPYAGGVYCQTLGPRFETRAEIRFLATVGDVVGMTCANETALASEIEIPYCLICMVDNYCNGVGKPLTVDEFHSGVAKNQSKVEQVAQTILNLYELA